MKPVLTLPALALIVACTAPESGVRDPARFEQIATRDDIASNRSAPEVARCFGERAVLLPSSEVRADADGRGAIYTLRIAGYTFEEIRFRPEGRGSVATVLVAPGVNDGWRRGLERDRLEPLRLCAAG